MHVSWYWIKQRPHFLAINLSEYFNTTILYPMSVRYWRNKKTTPENCMAIPQFPLSRFSIIKKLNIQLYRFSTKRKLKNCDIVWFGNPDDFVFVSDLIPSKVYVIYDCMDDLCEFPGSTAKSIANTILYESKLIERANLLIASSRKLALVLESRYKTHKPIKIVNNGIDSEFIAQQQTSEIINYPQKLNHKDLMYIGTISEWFNFPLLIDALQIHPELRLILIGPKCSIIPEHERIIHLGTQPHKLLPVFMNRADALIMPFVVNELILAVNPVKLYEYLTTDKPIITCYYPEIAPFGNLVYSYSSENDFQILIGKLINSTLKAESDEMRIAFLNANTWQQRVRGIADLIGK
jgi:glycosyltransferase involved in cell wall biosynthesis